MVSNHAVDGVLVAVVTAAIGAGVKDRARTLVKNRQAVETIGIAGTKRALVVHPTTSIDEGGLEVNTHIGERGHHEQSQSDVEHGWFP